MIFQREWRRFRSLSVGDLRWNWGTPRQAPSGLWLTAPWIGLEFPRLVRVPLLPPEEYFVESVNQLRTTHTQWLQRFVVVIWLAILLTMPLWVNTNIFLVLCVMMGPFFVLILITARRSLSRFPRFPLEMLLSPSREYQEHLLLTTLTEDDLFHAQAALQYRTPSRLLNKRNWYLFLYGIPPALMLAGGYEVRTMLPTLALLATVDFLTECLRGRSLAWEVFGGYNTPGTDLQRRILTRRSASKFPRGRRVARETRFYLFVTLLDLPLVMLVIIGTVLTSFPSQIIYHWSLELLALAVALFVAARSPLPAFFHRIGRLRARHHHSRAIRILRSVRRETLHKLDGNQPLWLFGG